MRHLQHKRRLQLPRQNPNPLPLLLVEDAGKGEGVWIYPEQLKTPFVLKVPHPKLEVGINTLIWLANPYLLILCVLIFPGTFLFTTFRWHKLLKALDIQLILTRTSV